MINHLGEKADTDAQLRALKYQLEYCYNEIVETYFDKLFIELEDCIKTNDTRRIINNTDRIISNCIFRGWSANALYNVIDMLFDSEKESNKWELFKSPVKIVTICEV